MFEYEHQQGSTILVPVPEHINNPTTQQNEKKSTLTLAFSTGPFSWSSLPLQLPLQLHSTQYAPPFVSYRILSHRFESTMPSSTTFISQPSTMSSAYGTYVLSYFDSNMMDPSNSEGRIQTSVTVFLITLAASEVVIYTICKIMAWYAHVTFYAQGDMNWIHETTTDPSINSQDPSIPSTDTTDTADSHDPSWNDIQNALFTSMYNTAATTKERLFIPIPAPVQAPVLVPLSSNNDDDEGDDNDDDHTCPICLNDFGTLSIC